MISDKMISEKISSIKAMGDNDTGTEPLERVKFQREGWFQKSN
jgi:hypothetical protein